MYEALKKQLVSHEGMRTALYRCTSGKLTIGVGYNLDDRGLGEMSQALGRTVTLADLQRNGLNQADAMTVLEFDIKKFEREVVRRWPLYQQLDDVRKRVVMDFVFNMGHTRAAKFKSAISAITLATNESNPRIKQAFYTEAAFHMADSIWARQVDDGLAGRKGRADRLVYMMRTGKEMP